MNSNSRTPRNIYSRDGRAQATDKSSSGKSPVDEAAQQGTSEEDSTQPMELKETNDESEQRQGQSADKRSTGEDMKGYLNRDYRDLLNSMVEEAAGNSRFGSGDLDPSYMGCSYWTAEEKAAVFQGLAVKGRNDPAGISGMVRTKSQIEVRIYLLALENGCSDGQYALLDSHSTPSSPSAAYEIGERCERATDLTAEALERFVLRRDIEHEKRKFGEFWLIDDEIAAEIELHQQQKSPAAAIGDDQHVAGVSDHSSAESESQDDAIEVQSDDESNVSEKSPVVHTISSTDLLKPEALLKLSRSLFMNSAINAEANWSQLRTGDGGPTPPAMFRSAFDSFGTIAINFTRWIVKAAMFQAISRLRAKDEQNPTAIVTTQDARTAIEFLNLNSDWKKYWAGVARRCGVEVYSGSDKYRDSRPGTRDGRLLRYDEVETELGLSPSEVLRDLENGHEGIKDESTPSTSSDGTDKQSEQGSESSEGSSDEQTDVESNDSSVKIAKRKRGASISSDENEDKQLNAADEQAGRAEERRLMKMLRYAISPSPSPRAEEINEEKNSHRRKRNMLDQRNNWRSTVENMAAWEQQRVAIEMNNGEEQG